MTNPTDPRVEAAAQLIGCVTNFECGGDWNRLSPTQQKWFRDIAATVLDEADTASWQPIETAPMHQDILIAWGTGTVSVGRQYGAGWVFANGDEMYGVHKALAWMPMLVYRVG